MIPATIMAAFAIAAMAKQLDTIQTAISVNCGVACTLMSM
jgi:hypothetical protein